MKRAAETLRESERQWREVFEHNPVMYFQIDATGTVLSVNAFGAAQLGYTVTELVGQSVWNIFFEEDREFVQKNVAVCVERLGQSNSWEVRKVRKDGTVIWVRENAKAMRRADDRLIVLVACEDITERKRVEDALRQSELSLAHANRVATIGELTTSIAHEVNQPIAALIINAQTALRLLRTEPPDLVQGCEALDDIIKDGRRASDVIERIRALVKN
jgi:PAS domain S-box-containing protein